MFSSISTPEIHRIYFNSLSNISLAQCLRKMSFQDQRPTSFLLPGSQAPSKAPSCRSLSCDYPGLLYHQFFFDPDLICLGCSYEVDVDPRPE